VFEARRLAYPALERLGPVLTEDVCVPRSRIPAMPEQISAIAGAPAVITTTGQGRGSVRQCGTATLPGRKASAVSVTAASHVAFSPAGYFQ